MTRVALLDLSGSTWLDFAVNLIPLCIIVGVVVLLSPLVSWEWSHWLVFWERFLTVFAVVLLLLVVAVGSRVFFRANDPSTEER